MALGDDRGPPVNSNRGPKGGAGVQQIDFKTRGFLLLVICCSGRLSLPVTGTPSEKP